MMSFLLMKAKDRFASLLADVCPCLNVLNKKSHNIEDLQHKSKKSNGWAVDSEADVPNGKIFTIETMKKIAKRKLLKQDIETQDNGDCFELWKCPWNSESSDMLLRVERSIFPVHRFLLSIESEILKTIIDSIPTKDGTTTVVTLNGYNADEIEMLLTFVYLPETEISDENVLILLRLADELMIEELVIRCEEYFLTTMTHSPISLLQIAHKYQLPSLEEAAAIQASKLNCVEEACDFKNLTKKQQDKVLNMSKNRFRCGGKPAPPKTEDGFFYETTSPLPELKSDKLASLEKELHESLAFFPESATNEHQKWGTTRT